MDMRYRLQHTWPARHQAHLPPASIRASFSEEAFPRSWSGVMMSVASNTDRISLCSSVTSASVMLRTLMNLRKDTGDAVYHVFARYWSEDPCAYTLRCCRLAQLW